MLTVGNKAVIPYSGSSQESPRTGKTKRSQSSQLSVKTCERENRVNRLFSPGGGGYSRKFWIGCAAKVLEP